VLVTQEQVSPEAWLLLVQATVTQLESVMSMELRQAPSQ